MKITDVFGLHYESFIIQVEGTEEEIKNFRKLLDEIWPEKKFLIVVKGGNFKYDNSNMPGMQ